MGYQESHITVDNLAEAAGIIRAFKEMQDHEWISVYGAERSTRELHYGDPFGFNEDRPLDQCFLIPEGELSVVVQGDRNPYQPASEFRYIDGIVEIDKISYGSCFEKISDDELSEAARESPGECERAYGQAKRFLEHVHDDDRPFETRFCRVNTLEEALAERERFRQAFPYLARSAH